LIELEQVRKACKKELNVLSMNESQEKEVIKELLAFVNLIFDSFLETMSNS